MTLSPQIRQEISDIISSYEFPRGALLPVLYHLQRLSGCLCEDDLRPVAEMMGLPPVYVFGVATFYSLLYTEPMGQNVILACNNISCYLRDAETVLMALERELGIKPGQTTPDKRFTLHETSCLGACDRSPAMMINGKMYYDLTPEKIKQILAEC